MNPIRYDTFWNAVLSLPSTKKMLALSLETCSSCNLTVIETALDNYTGKNGRKCGKCGFYSTIISFWIDFLGRSMSIRKEKIQKLLSDPYARRAILTITRTFRHIGIRKPLSIYAPFLVVWDFTHKCNLLCRHCYSNAGSGKTSEEELTTDEALDVVNQLADFGVTALAFSGGEPLARTDFFEVAKQATKRGLYVSVATNGTLLNKEMVRRLKKARINYVEVSIDGAKAETHDEFRGVSGAFQGAVEGLKNCIEENLCACVATTATKSNLKEIPEVLNMAKEIGVERFTYFNFIPTGRGKQFHSLDLPPEEREKLLIFLLNKILNGFGVTILTTAPQLARVALQQQGTKGEIAMSLAHMQTAKIGKGAVALADFVGGCGAGRLYCSISPGGDVHPCVFLPIKVGNLR
ncbi:radical SAM protein, partial [Candidatus Bathyarchaeota archaeon]|nr:radical SAM protein [Candidatus Bathyarchaeota archaeon]